MFKLCNDLVEEMRKEITVLYLLSLIRPMEGNSLDRNIQTDNFCLIDLQCNWKCFGTNYINRNSHLGNKINTIVKVLRFFFQNHRQKIKFHFIKCSEKNMINLENILALKENEDKKYFLKLLFTKKRSFNFFLILYIHIFLILCILYFLMSTNFSLLAV